MYGHPSPPSPLEKDVDRLVWYLFITAGLFIFIVAVALAAEGNFAGLFVLTIYLMFAGIAFFAGRDLKQIKMITPDPDDPEEQAEPDDPSLAEDYFAQINWQRTHRKRHHPTRWEAPEPHWRYRRVETSTQFEGYGALLVYGFFIVLSVAFASIAGWILEAFGISPLATMSILVVLGLTAAGIYLISQD